MKKSNEQAVSRFPPASKKRGTTSLINALIDLVIVIIVIIALIFIITKFLQPNYNINEEYAKAQLKAIEEKFKETEATGQPVEHLIIALPRDSGHYLVHFEDKNSQYVNYEIDKKSEPKTWERILAFFAPQLDNEIGIERIKVNFMKTLNKENILCICQTIEKKEMTQEEKETKLARLALDSRCYNCKELKERKVDFEVLPLHDNQLLQIKKTGETYSINEITS